MRISSTDAADELEDLVVRAETGEEIILTDGDIAVRLVPTTPKAGHQTNNAAPATEK